MAPRKEPAVLTAAEVAELLARPDRARVAEAAQAEAEARAPGDAKLRDALAARLAALAPMRDAVGQWFEGRPHVGRATFEEALGEHAAQLLDRVVLLGIELQKITTGPAVDAAEQALARLADPADAAARRAALLALRALEEREPIARHRLAALLALRAHTVEELTRAIDTTRTQIAWLQGGSHESHV
jgi:hypothetical protein